MTFLLRAACVVGLTVVSCGPPVMPPTSGHAPPEAAQSTATLDGEVLGVDGRSPETQLAKSVRLRLLTESGSRVEVVLAPAWVLDEKGLSFTPKERVRVKGKKTVKAGEPVFEAQTIERDTKIHKLRDETGKQLWRDR